MNEKELKHGIITNWIGGRILSYNESRKDFAGELQINGEPCNGPIAMDTFDPDHRIEARLLDYGPEMEGVFNLILRDLSTAYERQELSDREFAGMAHAVLVGIYRARGTNIEKELQKYRRRIRVRNWARQVLKRFFRNKKGGKQ